MPSVAAVGGRSLRAQLRQANGLGVAWTVTIGEDELSRSVVRLKNMADGGNDEELPTAALLDRLAAGG